MRLKSTNSLDRWYGFRLELDLRAVGPERVSLIREGLKDESPVFRCFVLLELQGEQPDVPIPSDLLPDLQRVATSDADPMNRTIADEVVRQATK